jgi:CubicO group peptidase (beta-lactamase class C family)
MTGHAAPTTITSHVHRRPSSRHRAARDRRGPGCRFAGFIVSRRAGMPMRTTLRAALAPTAALASAGLGQGAAALRERHADLRPAPAASPFGGRWCCRPAASAGRRVMSTRSSTIRSRVGLALHGSAHCFQMLTLQFNIKRWHQRPAAARTLRWPWAARPISR